MRFLFKYPTRGRPQWFQETLNAYYSKLSGKHEYQFVIAMDNNDETMNNVSMRDWLASLENLTYYYRDHANKIQACNTGIPNDGWDILVLISDDMTPVVQDFDDIIAQDMLREFPALDGALHYNDGYAGKPLLTLSIMGKKLYDRIGFVYWPAYEGLWCDNDFMSTVKKWNKYWYCDKVIIRHEWLKHGRDETYKQGESSYYEDKKIYDARKILGFPVTFSQNDCDYIIRRFFKDRFDGRFLDIGAGDGVTFSNTKLLYDMGWCGIAVEPSPSLCEGFLKNIKRDRVKLITACLTAEDGPVQFFDSQGDFISTTNEEHRKKWSAQTNYIEILREGISWQTLLNAYGSDFDFINLDIEGENIPMLQLMPSDYKRRARLICVEYDNKLGVVKSELEPYGFKVLHTNGENVIMGK